MNEIFENMEKAIETFSRESDEFIQKLKEKECNKKCKR